MKIPIGNQRPSIADDRKYKQTKHRTLERKLKMVQHEHKYKSEEISIHPKGRQFLIHYWPNSVIYIKDLVMSNIGRKTRFV